MPTSSRSTRRASPSTCGASAPRPPRRRPFFCFSARDEAAYRQIQEAGHPALEEALADLDQAPAQTAEQLRANLDQAHERRMELASETLRLATTGSSR
ncbi:hypothetical protein ACFRCX_28710 [Streptomyces sp. NPDC056652]|uniref:hypothetical protein n=1 Tax=Streptomyces sp. NPDC056652 TaxID=3345893 RepID=UPI0036CA7059